jgi:hypothetical protein
VRPSQASEVCDKNFPEGKENSVSKMSNKRKDFEMLNKI